VGTYLRLTAALRDVLRCLLDADDEVWGLQLVNATQRSTGTVYPLLERLERELHVQSRWDDEPERRGARRRLYMLTPEGRAWATTRLGPAQKDDEGD
jgi:PadR family transcriptional regulator, regulatory protein PadR